MIAPLVPVTRNVKTPAEAPSPAVIVNVDVAVPPDDGVTGLGSVNEASEGAVPTHDPDRVTAELKALSDPNVIVAVPLDP